ncbi:MAG TPA: hypothetical protein VE524_03210 [Nitrososphaeraceae archaeon]|nr:hypothetical protein [Nitrososphaeraceae archaeon]
MDILEKITAKMKKKFIAVRSKIQPKKTMQKTNVNLTTKRSQYNKIN